VTRATLECTILRLFQFVSFVSFDCQLISDLQRDEESWLARCICGAIIGRRHERRGPDGTTSAMYRLFKYAVRPISQIAESVVAQYAYTSVLTALQTSPIPDVCIHHARHARACVCSCNVSLCDLG
jgi:hypothetical protein